MMFPGRGGAARGYNIRQAVGLPSNASIELHDDDDDDGVRTTW